MSVYQKDGFSFFKKVKDVNSDKADGLIIDEARIEAIRNYLLKSGLKKIIINSRYGKVSDLSFLRYLPFIQSITMADDNHNISPVNDLQDLRELRIGGFTGAIDFSKIPNLEILGVSWSTKLKNFETAKNLTWLWLEGYKDESLDKLKGLTKLSYLYLYSSKIKALGGIGHMPLLRELWVDNAKYLESLDGFDQNNKELKVLDVFKAPQLTDYDALKYLTGMEKLRFAKCGDMQNIDFIRSMTKLKRLILAVKVLDGDMKLPIDIEEYKFVNYPHYNLKSGPM